MIDQLYSGTFSLTFIHMLSEPGLSPSAMRSSCSQGKFKCNCDVELNRSASIGLFMVKDTRIVSLFV